MEEWRESTQIGRWKGRRCKSIGGGTGAMGLGSRHSWIRALRHHRFQVPPTCYPLSFPLSIYRSEFSHSHPPQIGRAGRLQVCGSHMLMPPPLFPARLHFPPFPHACPPNRQCSARLAEKQHHIRLGDDFGGHTHDVPGDRDIRIWFSPGSQGDA